VLIVRASWSALIASFFIGALLVVGFFVFHPVYINVCHGGQRGAAQKCEPNNILYVAFLNILEIMTHAEFWTAVATIFIAAFTFTLKRSTDKLWAAGEKQIGVTKKAADAAQVSAQAAADSVQIAKEFLERAYVFGGCGDQNFTRKPIMVVNATHGNYGKTPGFVECVFIEHCLERDLPTKPRYINRIAVNDSLPPTGQVKRINRTKVEFSVTNGQIYYGRIIYVDVFKIRHHS